MFCLLVSLSYESSPFGLSDILLKSFVGGDCRFPEVVMSGPITRRKRGK